MRSTPAESRAQALAAWCTTGWRNRHADDTLSVPTMLSEEEQRLYTWLGQNALGTVVELGCFAGGSTARLADGTRACAKPPAIHAFDRFTADDNVKHRFLYPAGVAPFAGKDILDLAERLLAPWPNITLHKGEIDRQTWTEGPIDILVLDASKKAETMDRMAEIFFPHLIPGQSLLVQQDYLHWKQPWVPVQMEVMAASVEPLGHVPSDTMVFRWKGAKALPKISTLDDGAMLRHLDAAARRLAPWGIEDALRRTAEGLRANPGKRHAHRFQ